jgi:uncharacterized membrane protein
VNSRHTSSDRLGVETPGTAPRVNLLDALRGLAIIGMIIYHMAWDLDFLGFADVGVTASAGWQWTAYIVAGTFLTVSGFSLAFMTAHRLRLLAFGRRLLTLALCAAAVTLATWFLMPDTFIFFGILHAIAVSGVICLFFARLPPIIILIAGVGVLWAGNTVTLPALDHPAWLWTGLQPTAPISSDYVPIFPWAGLMLLGLAAGRLLTRRTAALETIAAIEPDSAPARALIWLGRKSLLIYMVHQPILIGILMAVAVVIGTPGSLDTRATVMLDLTTPGQAMHTAAFLSSCESNCRDAGGGDLCVNYCRCVVSGLQETPLWMGDGVSESDILGDPEFLQVVETCQAASPGLTD